MMLQYKAVTTVMTHFSNPLHDIKTHLKKIIIRLPLLHTRQPSFPVQAATRFVSQLIPVPRFIIFIVSGLLHSVIRATYGLI